jgi:hypothetical protein
LGGSGRVGVGEVWVWWWLFGHGVGRVGWDERGVDKIAVLTIDLENADGVWSVARSVYKKERWLQVLLVNH